MNPTNYIGPFVEYSKRYRDSADPDDRLKVRDQWIEAIMSLCQLEGKPTRKTFRHDQCVFCGTTDDCDRVGYFCSKCFFPLFYCDTCCITDSTVFALLSVCYWESSNRDDASHNLYVVWRERVRMAWYCELDALGYHKPRCNFAIDTKSCVQCHHREDDAEIVDRVYSEFDYRLFCEQCLFPRFYCVV